MPERMRAFATEGRSRCAHRSTLRHVDVSGRHDFHVMTGGAAAVLTGLGSSTGLYLLAAAMVLMIGSQVWSAWVRIAEVTE